MRYDYTFFPAYGTNATIGKNGGIETGDWDWNNGTYIVQKLAAFLYVPVALLPVFREMALCLPTSL